MRLSLAVVLACSALSARAHAFGGVWAQDGSVEQTAAQILFVDNPGATVTAVVQIQLAAAPERFAWLIPVKGTPTVALSSNAVLARLDAATAPLYWLEVDVEGECMNPASLPAPGEGAIALEESGSAFDHRTVVVDAALSDPVGAAIEALAQDGYDFSELDRDALAPYVADGFNLLAFKLKDGANVRSGALRPVMLTYEDDLPRIPIVPSALSASPDMPIQVWVVGPSQAIPSNYKSLILNDALLDWPSGLSYVAGTLPAGGDGSIGPYLGKLRNYDAVVTQAADEGGGQGFVTELAAPASQFREALWSPLDEETFASLSGYADGIDAVVAAYAYYAGWDGLEAAFAGAATLPDGVTLEALARDPDAYRDVVEIDSARFLEQLEASVVKPVADTAALLYQGPYLTRLFSTMSARDMTLDPRFDYNADLAQISGVHLARQHIDCSDTRTAERAPWRIELPQGGIVTGEGDAAWPVALGSMPANLKVVMLGTSGAGDVTEDNRAAIRDELLDAWDLRDDLTLPQLLPQHGALIGGVQTLALASAPTDDESDRDDAGAADAGEAETMRGGGCSVARAQSVEGSRTALWLVLASALLALRRRGKRAWLVLALLAACDGAENAGAPDADVATQTGALTPEQLRDPESCKGCHPAHYQQWASSMHAYSAKDPVFIAMNKRGQRETNGELGDFCIKCHAPMAVVDELTPNGLDLDDLPDRERGVSCYFCHNVVGIEGDHNAMLRLANDSTMRGPIRDPLRVGAHRAEHSDLFEEGSASSSALCGACHDIVTPSGVHLERTLQEYQAGLFSKSATGEPEAFDSCVGCHMPPDQGLAANVPGAPLRPVHEHMWPAIDVALDAHPARDAMNSAVEDCTLDRSISFFTLEVTPPDLFTFQIQTAAGHNMPSGASQDRRMWLELSAYDGNGTLLEEVSSGQIGDGEIEEWPEGDPKHDPHLLMFRDRIYDAQGEPVHMFWEAAKSSAYPDGYESQTLSVPTSTYLDGKHALLKQYRVSDPSGGLPARVTARLRMRPIGMDVLQDLVDSGDLAPEIAAQMPTFTVGAPIEWTPAAGLMKTIRAEPGADCTTYRCLLNPSGGDCR